MIYGASENMLTIKMQVILYLLLLGCMDAFPQHEKINPSFLYGKWKVVKHDYRGYQKFSAKQANQLHKSILVIEKTRYYFTNINFIGPCPIYKWNIQPYDTTISISMPIEQCYTKKELAERVSFLEPVDNKGEPCYNECLMFLKQDTLITVVGGYTFFRLKIK